jgi:hypothetical protein
VLNFICTKKIKKKKKKNEKIKFFVCNKILKEIHKQNRINVHTKGIDKIFNGDKNYNKPL